MTNSHYIGNPRFRKFVGEKKTHYVPVEHFVNAADNVLVDTYDPHSRGFGGSTFDIRVTDNDYVDTVKGPWHGTVPYEVCNVTELYFTKVTLIANAQHIPYGDWPEIEKKYGRDSVEFRLRMTGDVLYQEYMEVLGTFFRGDRIAQQLADLRQETIFVHVESSSGSHSHECRPGDRLHPLAHRSGSRSYNDLSADQGMIVDA